MTRAAMLAVLVNTVLAGTVAAVTPRAAATATLPGAPTIFEGAPDGPGTYPGDRSATFYFLVPSDGGSPITGYAVTPYIGSVAQPTVTLDLSAIHKLVAGSNYEIDWAVIRSVASVIVEPAIPSSVVDGTHSQSTDRPVTRLLARASIRSRSISWLCRQGPLARSTVRVQGIERVGRSEGQTRRASPATFLPTHPHWRSGALLAAAHDDFRNIICPAQEALRAGAPNLTPEPCQWTEIARRDGCRGTSAPERHIGAERSGRRFGVVPGNREVKHSLGFVSDAGI